VISTVLAGLWLVVVLLFAWPAGGAPSIKAVDAVTAQAAKAAGGDTWAKAACSFDQSQWKPGYSFGCSVDYGIPSDYNTDYVNATVVSSSSGYYRWSLDDQGGGLSITDSSGNPLVVSSPVGK
jgi:hypothetical protein